MQTILDVNRRPVVPFNVNNAEHRRCVSQFLKDGTWANSPVSFYAPDGVSVRAFAVEQLVSYYLKNEFADKKNSRRTGKLIAV